MAQTKSLGMIFVKNRVRVYSVTNLVWVMLGPRLDPFTRECFAFVTLEVDVATLCPNIRVSLEG